MCYTFFSETSTFNFLILLTRSKRLAILFSHRLFQLDLQCSQY